MASLFRNKLVPQSGPEHKEIKIAGYSSGSLWAKSPFSAFRCHEHDAEGLAFFSARSRRVSYWHGENARPPCILSLLAKRALLAESQVDKEKSAALHRQSDANDIGTLAMI